MKRFTTLCVLVLTLLATFAFAQSDDIAPNEIFTEVNAGVLTSLDAA
jgi:hypothetical protein